MTKAKILVVEDEGIIVWNIRNALKRFGYRVVGVAASGAEALQKVAETKPDLVLMDIRLQGGMDGIEAAEQIRLQFNIPVVYLTAHANDNIIGRAKATEPFGYIIKPFQEKELNATIELALYKFKIEKNLHTEREWFSKVLKSMGDSVVVTDDKGTITFMNPYAETLTGWEKKDALGKSVSEVLPLVNTSAAETEENPIIKAIEQGVVVRLADQWILRTKDGEEMPISDSAAPIRDKDGNITGVVAIFQDITERKRAEEALRKQAEREQLIGLITQRIRQSLNLRDILYTTVIQVQQFLQTDRVLVYRFEPDWSGIVAVESVNPQWTSLLGRRLLDPCFAQGFVELYRQGRIQVTNDIYNEGLAQCHIELLEQFQARANLVVPILQGDQLWGLLVAHECQAPRQWQRLDVSLLQQLAAQLAIAIQQSELYEQVRSLNADLEGQVRQRTAQLQRSLTFEATLKRITDRVRDSLDQNQILQAAVEELSQALTVDGCDAALYDLKEMTSTITYECVTGVSPAQGTTICMTNFEEEYNQLLQGQYFQFCQRPPGQRGALVILACPISDNDGVIGDLWLFKQQDYTFDELEIRLVEQVANQCAIAIRQARLYQKAQLQVTELAKLNQLKDDFLSTVSHELRTPVANIHLSLQMLDIIMQREGVLNPQSEQASRYFQILKNECRREIDLINDLLTLQEVDVNTEPLRLSTIALQDWILHIIEPFEVTSQNQNQILNINIAPDLPPFTTDISRLSRILTELLNNACKFAPEGAQITVNTRAIDEGLELSVSNSDSEIPPEELTKIFDKFYRVPNHDPWKTGGTGMGLTIIKKLVESLSGSIVVESKAGLTTFTLLLPWTIVSGNESLT
ncbi:MAG TPA: GAF domain-containing protein [Trichocoleus sp.]|jgi:PAS domain S-box-containing protein